jgi:chemotaxis protein MotB
MTLFLLAVFVLSGCSYIQKARRTDDLEIENQNLRARITQLQKEKTKEVEHVVKQKDRELSELEKAKLELEDALKKEIGNYKAKLEMTERGLVITFLSEVFFDSGKDVVRGDGKESLQKVAEVLNQNVPNSNVAIEGHTDNQPIRYSSWKTNWELSSARALAVLHYLIDECNVKPTRLSANGYGEFRPVVLNDTKENMQKNRRVEIVILPSKISKIKAN